MEERSKLTFFHIVYSFHKNITSMILYFKASVWMREE